MTLSELQILLSLNGNQRLAHLEEEIFANKLLYSEYLHTLCKQYQWYYPAIDNKWLVYHYARYVIKSRWVEAEFLLPPHFNVLLIDYTAIHKNL